MNLNILVFSIFGFVCIIAAPTGDETKSETDILSNTTPLVDSEIKDNPVTEKEINDVEKNDNISTQTPAIEDVQEIIEQSIVGEGTSRLSQALLAGYAESKSNIVLSPLGYSSLLALVAEGAKDETRQQLLSALGVQDLQPEPIRQAFRSVLKSLKREHSPNHNPELKNWFYVSDKYSVNEDYIKLLKEYYLTEVKIIKDWLSDEEETKKITPQTITNNYKNEETKETSIKENTEAQTALDQVVLEEYNSQQNQIDVNLNQTIKEESSKNNEEIKNTTQEEEKINENDNDMSNSSPTNINENNPLLDLMAQHSSVKKTNRNSKELYKNKDVTNGFSGNKFAAKDSMGSMMLAFNGLYFGGKWPSKSINVLKETIPFKSGLNGSKVVEAQMLEFTNLQDSEDNARYGYIEEFHSKAFEIPYKGGRYVLLMVVPDKEDGLPSLIHRIHKEGLQKVKNSLKPSEKSIIFPRFEIETTTQPRKSFNSMGIYDLFNKTEADLSGISSEPGLYVHDLAQFVAVKVDAKLSSVNFITAEGFAVGRAEEFTESEKEVIDRPFAFYILDRNNGVVIVTGRIVDPTQVPSLFNITKPNPTS